MRDDLCERLERRYAASYGEDGNRRPVNPDGPEAAARIRDLEAQLAAAREAARAEVEAEVIAYFRHAAEGVRLDADNGLWEGIEDQVQESIDEFNGYADSIAEGQHRALKAAPRQGDGETT